MWIALGLVGMAVFVLVIVAAIIRTRRMPNANAAPDDLRRADDAKRDRIVDYGTPYG